MGSPFHSQTLVTLDKSLFSFGLSNRRISAVFSCFDQSLILPVRPYKEARLYYFYLGGEGRCIEMWHTAKSLSWRPIKHFHAVPFLTADGRRLPICAMILHTVQQYFPVCFICICLEQKKLFFFTLPP